MRYHGNFIIIAVLQGKDKRKNRSAANGGRPEINTHFKTGKAEVQLCYLLSPRETTRTGTSQSSMNEMAFPQLAEE